MRAGRARRRRAGAAEHAAQDVLEAAAAARRRPPARWKPSGPKLKLSKWLPPPGPKPAPPPGCAAFEALEARLALGVDLAAVEGLALLVVADDLVGGIELGEARGRLGIVLVGVGMQLLGELAGRRS